MNLTKLFDMQEELDERIIKQKGLEGKDLLPSRILALQVELGELANEWRGFKFWSDDREPRTVAERGACKYCAGTGSIIPGAEGVPDCWACNGEGEEIYNPLLEEYVDCLHFILSIGLSEYEKYEKYSVPINYMFMDNEPIKEPNVTHQFNSLFLEVGILFDSLFDNAYSANTVEDAYENLFRLFIGLGEMLGFTWEEIEQAYIDKNQVNHERQRSGY